MNELEITLSNCQWIGGDPCSEADKEAFAKHCSTPPNVKLYPHTYAWYTIVSQFQWAQKTSSTSVTSSTVAQKEQKPEKKAAPFTPRAHN